MTTATTPAELVDRATRHPVDGSTVRDRYRAVLLGVAAGNALGIPADGESRSAIHRHWPAGLKEVDPGERDRPWDDDLAETAVLAEALIHNDELDPNHLAAQLLQWSRQNGRGIGQLTRDTLARLDAGTPALEAAREAWERGGLSSAGNGAVARCAPVALRFRTSGDQLVRAARTSALVTHYDARCEWSTVAFAVCLAILISGESPSLGDLAGSLSSIQSGSRETASAMQEVQEAIIAVDEKPLQDLALDDPMDMGYTLKAMQVALWSSQQRQDFEAVVTGIVNAGGATDTNGAICGAVMGARCGTDSIPARWLDAIAGTDELTRLADALYDASTRSTI